MELLFERGDQVELVQFDATLRESFGAGATIPTRPVEAGADVADHVVPGAQKFSAVVVITDTPLVVPGTQMYGVTGQVESVSLKLGGRPRMTKGANATKGTAAEYDSATDTAQVSTLHFSESFSRVERVLAVLETVRVEALRCTVLTTIRELDDVYLTSISTPRTRTKGVEVTLDFTQVRVAESQVVDLPEPEEPRARAGRDAGRQRTTEPDAVTEERGTSALLAVATALGLGGA